jgi:hypothetical protein
VVTVAVSLVVTEAAAAAIVSACTVLTQAAEAEYVNSIGKRAEYAKTEKTAILLNNLNSTPRWIRLLV